MNAQPDLIRRPIQITRIFISPGHNFFGRAEIGAGTNPIQELTEVECVAGSGLRGDRFFDYKKNYKGQVTFFAEETYNDLCAMFQVWDRDLSVFRRNLITRGTDLNELIGRHFTIQGVTFLGSEESKPCFWMNQAFHPGAEHALKGRGGLRAKILTNGTLRTTPR